MDGQVLFYIDYTAINGNTPSGVNHDAEQSTQVCHCNHESVPRNQRRTIVHHVVIKASASRDMCHWQNTTVGIWNSEILSGEAGLKRQEFGLFHAIWSFILLPYNAICQCLKPLHGENNSGSLCFSNFTAEIFPTSCARFNVNGLRIVTILRTESIVNQLICILWCTNHW